MLDCKMDIAVSAMVFFYRIGTILAKDSQRYFETVDTGSSE